MSDCCSGRVVVVVVLLVLVAVDSTAGDGDGDGGGVDYGDIAVRCCCARADYSLPSYRPTTRTRTLLLHRQKQQCRPLSHHRLNAETKIHRPFVDVVVDVVV